MKYLKEIGVYLLIGMFFLGMIITYGASVPRETNAYFLLVGITLIAVPVIAGLIYERVRKGKVETRHYKKLE